MRGHQRHRGISLIEVLLATALAALILASVTTALSSITSSVRTNDRHIRSRQTASTMLNYMLSKIRRAKMITCKPAGAADDLYTRVEILDSGVWNKTTKSYGSTSYTVIELFNGSVYVGSGSSANALTVTSGMDRVLTNVSALSFRSVPTGGVHTDVTVNLSVGAEDAFSGTTSEFSLAGSAALRSMID